VGKGGIQERGRGGDKREGRDIRKGGK